MAKQTQSYLTASNYDESLPQLQMAWPVAKLHAPPSVQLPAGYGLRPYQPGDEARFYQLMALAGWPGWNDDKLQPWLSRVLPEGWFMAVHQDSNRIVATAMALHNYKKVNPFQGEVGWATTDPAHTCNGLGTAVTAAVTIRFIEAGYRNIRLYTEDFRLAALKVYLKLGYIPLLYTPEIPARWQKICSQLPWPFTPEVWLR